MIASARMSRLECPPWDTQVLMYLGIYTGSSEHPARDWRCWAAGRVLGLLRPDFQLGTVSPSSGKGLPVT